MKVTLERFTIETEGLAGKAAAICYRGKNPGKSLEVAMKGGHHSVLEHAVFTFKVEGVSRVLLAQLTRHRLASFSVESQRYCGADQELVVPKSMKRYELTDDIVAVKKAVEALYKKALALGVKEEDARYMTLQAGQTKLMVTMNVRELLHFFSLRCCARAQWEIRDLAWEMVKQAQKVAPVVFEKAGPYCAQHGVCIEGDKCCGRAPRLDKLIEAHKAQRA